MEGQREGVIDDRISSRDGLMLDRSLSLSLSRWLVGEQWFPKKVSLDKLYRASRIRIFLLCAADRW